MADFQVLHFPNTASGQAAKIRSLRRYTAAEWIVVSEQLDQGKFKGRKGCCLGLTGVWCCGPVGALGALTAGHTTGTIIVTLTRQGTGGDFQLPMEARHSLVGCLLLLIGALCLPFFLSLLWKFPDNKPAQLAERDYREIPQAMAPTVPSESPTAPKAETMPGSVERDAIPIEIPLVPSRQNASRSDGQSQRQEERPIVPSDQEVEHAPAKTPQSFVWLRSWTDSSGKHTVEAEFVNYKNGEVHLKKRDGTIVSLAPSRLSVADRNYLETAFGIQLEQETISGRVTDPSSPLPRITNSIGIKLVLIAPGEFQMGSADSDTEAMSNEKPQHRVRITKPFYLGVYEVTQGEYHRMMGTNPSEFKGSDGTVPVENVSWNDALEFCRKLSSLPEEQSAGRAYRLPTQAEWEYGCRAGTDTRYCFGDDAGGLAEYAWYRSNSAIGPNRVGQKKPNAWGLYDMHGNVWEFCRDSDGSYTASTVDDPVIGRTTGGLPHVFRGGSWASGAGACPSASRCAEASGYRAGDIGFRVSMTLAF